MKLVCGVIKGDNKSYCVKRLILDVNNKNYVKENVNSWRLIVLKILGRLFPILEQKDVYCFRKWFYFRGRCRREIDIIHTYNRVCVTNKKWVCSFEGKVPAYFESQMDIGHRVIKKRLKLIEDNKCIKLLPMSKYAYDYEISLLKAHCKNEEIEKIKQKMEVLYPPQKLLVDSVDEGKYNNMETLKFIYVGRDFFRKGGYNCFCVLRELRKKYQIELTLIGKVNIKKDAGFRAKECNYDSLLEEMRVCKEWLNYYEELNNETVLKLIKESHVGLLPTYGDTFGFSVLEMQASGVPVVTTNRQALKEINNDNCGWIIDTYNYADVDKRYYIESDISKYEEFVQAELYKIVEDICIKPEQIQIKAVNAYERVRRDHSIDKYSDRLAEIYAEGLDVEG